MTIFMRVSLNDFALLLTRWPDNMQIKTFIFSFLEKVLAIVIPNTYFVPIIWENTTI